MIGFPVFVLWFGQTVKDPRKLSLKLWAALAGTAVLLYGSHALWFAAGGVWLVVIGLLKKTPATVIGLRLTTLVPCGVVALLWYPNLSALRLTGGFDVAPHWSPLFDRLASIMPSASGSIRGPVGTLAFIFMLSWAGLSIWQNRRRLRESTDRDLLAATFFFLAVVAVAPDKYMNTIYFSSR